MTRTVIIYVEIELSEAQRKLDQTELLDWAHKMGDVAVEALIDEWEADTAPDAVHRSVELEP